MSETLQEVITNKLKDVLEEKHELILSELPELSDTYPAVRDGKWVILPREKLKLTDRKRIAESLHDNEEFTKARLQHAFLQRCAFDLETIAIYTNRENRNGQQ